MIQMNLTKQLMKSQSDYILHFRLASTEKIQSIKNVLYSNKNIIDISSINPKDLIYAITTSHNEMRLVFERLKNYLEIGDAMSYKCNDNKMLCDCFVKPANEIVF